MQTSQCKHTYFCWICGNAVDLESCASDEQGMAVHEKCYALKLALATESRRLMIRKPARAVRRLKASDPPSRDVRSSTP